LCKESRADSAGWRVPPGEVKKCFSWSEKHFIAGYFKLPNNGIFFYETGSRLLRYINGSLTALSVVK